MTSTNKKPDINTVFQSIRRTTYSLVLGEPAWVIPGDVEASPCIDVLVYPPSDSRASFTYITCGMSNLPMPLPLDDEDFGPEDARAELIFYASEFHEDIAHGLQWLASVPFIDQAWFGEGLAIGGGQAFLGSVSENFTHLMFMTSIVKSDREILSKLVVNQDPVNVLWVIPLTKEEFAYKKVNGFDGMMDVFQDHQHPPIFDAQRKSYV